mmetsp:Transcript_10631/g.24209  ORF Transcript_10631/g.24209 Transcript_10631/m.24209 type:complete len:560 (-) Transcript_10631:138-1817(-)
MGRISPSDPLPLVQLPKEPAPRGVSSATSASASGNRGRSTGVSWLLQQKAVQPQGGQQQRGGAEEASASAEMMNSVATAAAAIASIGAAGGGTGCIMAAQGALRPTTARVIAPRTGRAMVEGEDPPLAQETLRDGGTARPETAPTGVASGRRNSAGQFIANSAQARRLSWGKGASAGEGELCGLELSEAAAGEASSSSTACRRQSFLKRLEEQGRRLSDDGSMAARLASKQELDGREDGADAAAGLNEPLMQARPSADVYRELHHDGPTGSSGSAGGRPVNFARPATTAAAGGSIVPEGRGVLRGTEDLPMVSALGVLVLPKRSDLGSEGVRSDNDVFSGWGEELDQQDLAPAMLFDLSRRESSLSEYVTQSSRGGNANLPVSRIDLEACEAATQMPASQASQGPSLLQLAQDVKRREECPICAAEWSRAMERMGASTCEPASPRERSQSPDPGKALQQAAGGRRKSTQGKSARAMHSVKCNWQWYQQNMMEKLAAQRFNLETGAAKSSTANPNSVLPPSMMDVFQHWKQRGGGRMNPEAERNTLTSDRLMKGEPASHS